jgi:hypothetical protein
LPLMNTPTVTIVLPSTSLLGLQSHNVADIRLWLVRK